MAKFLNTLFGALAAFFLCFLWVVYCTKNTAVAFGLAALVAAALGYIVFQTQKKLGGKKRYKRAEAKKISALAQKLRYNQNNGELFAEMMRYFRFEVSDIRADSLEVCKNGQKGFVALNFTAETLSRRDMAECVVSAKRANCDKLYIFANKAEKSLLSEADAQLPTLFADIANAAELLTQSGKLPPLEGQKSQPICRFLPKYAFCRKRFGFYIATTVFLVAISTVSFVKWYTLAWATASLAAAVYCLTNRRYNSLPTALTLD